MGLFAPGLLAPVFAGGGAKQLKAALAQARQGMKAKRVTRLVACRIRLTPDRFAIHVTSVTGLGRPDGAC